MVVNQFGSRRQEWRISYFHKETKYPMNLSKSMLFAQVIRWFSSFEFRNNFFDKSSSDNEFRYMLIKISKLSNCRIWSLRFWFRVLCNFPSSEKPLHWHQKVISKFNFKRFEMLVLKIKNIKKNYIKIIITIIIQNNNNNKNN